MTRVNCGDSMIVYVLIFQIGISHGHKKLIGLYDTEARAKDAQEKHMNTHCYSKHHYSIHKIELNKEVNIMFAEW